MLRRTKMANEAKHMFTTETESAKNKFNFKIEEYDLLLDIKALIKEYYIATFTQDGAALTINFNNGQKFRLAVSEIK